MEDKKNDSCPNCGYCPHCGRGGHQALPSYPTYPYPRYPTGPIWIAPTWLYNQSTCGNLTTGNATGNSTATALGGQNITYTGGVQ